MKKNSNATLVHETKTCSNRTRKMLLSAINIEFPEPLDSSRFLSSNTEILFNSNCRFVCRNIITHLASICAYVNRLVRHERDVTDNRYSRDS